MLPFDDPIAGPQPLAPAAFQSPVPSPQVPSPVDQSARLAAIDPSRNIVLEASAGTGKTRVLVERYINLLRAGVEPDHILAITFTRKAGIKGVGTILSPSHNW